MKWKVCCLLGVQSLLWLQLSAVEGGKEGGMDEGREGRREEGREVYREGGEGREGSRQKRHWEEDISDSVTINM